MSNLWLLARHCSGCILCIGSRVCEGRSEFHSPSLASIKFVDIPNVDSDSVCSTVFYQYAIVCLNCMWGGKSKHIRLIAGSERRCLYLFGKGSHVIIIEFLPNRCSNYPRSGAGRFPK